MFNVTSTNPTINRKAPLNLIRGAFLQDNTGTKQTGSYFLALIIALNTIATDNVAIDILINFSVFSSIFTSVFIVVLLSASVIGCNSAANGFVGIIF